MQCYLFRILKQKGKMDMFVQKIVCPVVFAVVALLPEFETR